MKRFLIGSLSLFLFALILTIGVFVLVSFLRTPPESLQAVKDAVESSIGTDSSNDTTVASSSAAALVPESGLPLASLALSDEQKANLEKVGIKVDSFVLSRAMVACAEAKLGTERVNELTTGNAPAAFEVAKLTPCLLAD